MAYFARSLCCCLLFGSLALTHAVAAAASPSNRKDSAALESQKKSATASSTSASRAATSAITPAKADYRAVHDSAIVVDTHADTPMRFADDSFDPGSDAGRGHWDLAKARAGNLGVEFFSIWVEPSKNKDHAAHRALDMIDSVYRVVAAHPGQLALASGTKEIRALRTGPHKKIAILMGIEGGHAIENDLSILRNYYRLGARYMTMTWANSTEWAQSSGDLPKPDPETGRVKDPGLNDFGRQIVREMNRIGMMVDVSHVSDRTFYHTLTVSRAPVIASHSSSRALTNSPRNMTDEMLVALARSGGVAMVNFNCGFLSDDYNKRSADYWRDHPQEITRYRDLYRKYMEDKSQVAFSQLQEFEAALNRDVPRPPFSVLVDHIDHIAKVAGVDHVGIGSDFDGVPCMPQGMNSVADLPKITEALLQRGYTSEQVHKILGGNLLRVFADVERVSRELASEKPMDMRREVKMPEQSDEPKPKQPDAAKPEAPKKEEPK